MSMFWLRAGVLVSASIFAVPGFSNPQSAKKTNVPHKATDVGTHYSVDTNKSLVKWLGSKKIGDSHNGTVKLKSGSVVLSGNKPVSGTFDIDLTTINDLDLKDASYKKKLETHLKSDDFFNVAKYPIATFTIVNAVPTSDKNTFTASGTLTVKQITKPISFPVVVSTQGNAATAKAKLKMNRADWDVRYNSGRFYDPKQLGDKIINDDVDLEVDLVAIAAPGSKAASTQTAPTKKQ